MRRFGLVCVAGYLFSTLSQTRDALTNRHAVQAFVFVVFGIYFVWFWSRGQTLAMKAWNIRLVSPGHSRIPARIALARLVLAAIFVGSFCAALAAAFIHRNPWLAFVTLAFSGIGLGWALFDRDRQFLHDRLAGTRLVLVEENQPV